MNERQRFNATMHYEARDRSPICDFGFWTDTIVEWRKQGLPDWVDMSNHDRYFGTDGLERYAISQASVAGSSISADRGWLFKSSVDFGLTPMFDERVIEDRGDHVLLQQPDGVRVVRRKVMSSIPQHDSHLLVDRASWNKHYKPRFDPDTPSRYPDEWESYAAIWRDPDRAYPLFLTAGSLYGWIRNLMGLEGVSYVVHDDPAFFEDMVTTIADCVVGVLERVLATGGCFDGCFMWEDMCFNTGPLLSPTHFKRFLVPHYKRITALLRKHGVDVTWVDCDGCIDQLIPLWMEAGVNCMMPIEVGTWGADAVRYRQEYGRELLIMGGFDKRILREPRKAIAAEVERLSPLVEEGGFIGFCDHRVPPDVTLANYLFFNERIRERWGHGVNLKPMAEEAQQIART